MVRWRSRVRALSAIRDGKPSTSFMANGDTVRIEMLDDQQQSIFGAIEQRVSVLN